MNNSKTGERNWVLDSILITLTIIVVSITIFLQSKNVVDEQESSTTFSYKEEVPESLVVMAVKEDVLKKHSITDRTEDKKPYLELLEESDKLKEINNQKYNDAMNLSVKKALREKELEKERLRRLAEKKKLEEAKKKKQVVSRGSQSVKRKVYVTATAYTSYCNTGCTGITATGLNVQHGITHNGTKIIAVDPNVIPLHSIVKVYPKDRDPFLAYAGDTGGDIKGGRIDVLVSVNDKSKAYDFGRQQNVVVEILREGKGG
jgi:3D (Asp-Asp-Asp) domain-containing protein